MPQPSRKRRPTVATDGSERELSQPSSGSPSLPSPHVPTFDENMHLGAHCTSAHEGHDSTRDSREGYARQRPSNLSYVARFEDDDAQTDSGDVELHRDSALATLMAQSRDLNVF